MKSFPQTGLRAASVIACVVAFTGAVMPFRAQADEWDKKTILTVDQPIQISKTVLQPGEYVLKLLSSDSDRHVVEIYTKDETHLIDTVIAIPNYRLQPTGNSRFSFWETPPGYAKALRAWFYPGDNFGQEFAYPKEPLALAAGGTATVTTASAETPTETPAAAAPAPAPAESSADRAAAEQPVETASAAPAPTPEPAAEPQATPQESAPATLPHTGSPYPIFGLAGLVALCLYGSLRLIRAS